MVLAIALALLTQPTHAQDLRYLHHQSWSTEDGLPQNSVHQILQTPDGFLWLSTEAGIARFDGIAFKTFSHTNDPAFLSDDACCLASSTNGDLWIGTPDGLILYRNQHFKRFDEKNGLPSRTVRALQPSRDGSLFITTDNGSAQWIPDHFITAPTQPSSPGINAPDGSIWTYTNTEVSRHSSTSSKQWKVGATLPGTRVETLFVDRAGTAWIGTNDGLSILTKDASTATPVPALNGNPVLQVFEDTEGNYWIGTESSGLHILRPQKFRTEPSLENQAVTAITETGNHTIWIGTREDGLRGLGPGVTPHPETLTSPVILSLAPGLQGSVWAGTPDGLNHVAANGNVQHITSAEGLPDDYIQSLLADPDGSVWIGTRHGLVHLTGDKMEILTRAQGLGGDLIGTLFRAQNGTLWIGTSTGLSTLAPDGKIDTFTTRNGLPEGIVTAITEDREGELWVATKGVGLSRLIQNTFHSIDVEALSSPINGISAGPQGYLWLRRDRGIDRILIAGLDKCAETNTPCTPNSNHYGLADGMPSEEKVAAGSPVLWSMANGELWFSTRRGVAILDPAHLPINPIPPPVAIEQFSVDELPIDTTANPIQIPFGHTRFTIDYAALSFTAPSEIRYRFLLEGFDRAWTDAGTRRTATYTNLPPGGYTFRVQAMNNDGLWNEAGATLPFRVIPPFYRRWWFATLVILAIAAISIALYRLRLRRLQARFDLVLNERNRMAREIHDTLAQDFVGVSIQLDIVSQLLQLTKVEAAIKQVQQTRKLVTDGLADARQSIWELRANLSQDSLPTRLAKVVERYSGDTLKIHLKISGAYRQLDNRIENEVLRIAQESLSNIQRHARAAEASIDLFYESDMLVLIVEDKGQGFAMDEAAKAQGHFGLSGMNERAKVLGASLDIVSSLGKGTKITLSTPIAGAKE
ncbi:sensor histidine kinase [Granulicella sibirica]|uniref:Two-component system sensor kinase n=1 Tax=Granulicella sibirica TaxID=2479048 RepID=A0A4Q0T5B3_9BACT|nr:sensor histidine kinase [Granulicella sibirica]RXH58935.1 two-component system sensor kinase [Granulicella sibirica]